MDKNCPRYHICIQIYESPEKSNKKSDDVVLTDIAAHTHFEELNGELESVNNSIDSSDYGNTYGGSAYIQLIPPKKTVIVCDTLPKCLPLTIDFNTENQRWDKFPFSYSKAIQGGYIGKKCDIDIGVVPCKNNGNVPKSIIAYCKSKKLRIYHYDIHHYLSMLYCNDSGKIQSCVSSTFPRISYPHYEYEKIRN